MPTNEDIAGPATDNQVDSGDLAADIARLKEAVAAWSAASAAYSHMYAVKDGAQPMPRLTYSVCGADGGVYEVQYSVQEGEDVSPLIDKLLQDSFNNYHTQLANMLVYGNRVLEQLGDLQ